jgi:hypothetical protein
MRQLLRNVISKGYGISTGVNSYIVENRLY